MTNASVQALIDKAAANLDAARLLLAAGHLDSAASRVYYSMFHVAEALLEAGPQIPSMADRCELLALREVDSVP